MIADICPQCGREVVWLVRGAKEKAYCMCNPYGPVMERDFPPPVEIPETHLVGLDLLDLPGVNREIMGALVAQGYTTIAQVQSATDEALLAISGIGPIRLSRIRGVIHNDHSPMG